LLARLLARWRVKLLRPIELGVRSALRSRSFDFTGTWAGPTRY
jgi:hypothetical protein